MQELFVDNQHAMQILTMLGIGAILVIVGCFLSKSLLDLLDRFSRLDLACKVVVLFFVVQLTMFGGAKHGGTNDVDGVTGTNDVELVEGGTNTNEELRVESDELMMMGQTLMSSTLHSSFLTLNSDSAAPYRLESVSTNEGYSYALPADGTIRGTWHLTGAYEDVMKVGLEGFSFPLGSDLCTSLWAYTWGKVRSRLKNASNGIAAVGAPMSAIPDVSRFWTMMTTNDTYLLTWENFAVGRQSPTTNNQQLTTLSAQLEFRRNGDFIARSNDVECVWRRRLPCDLDEDGWIDLVDPNPTVFNEGGFGPHQDLSVIVHSNNYYWVDLVVSNADAVVAFAGDLQSNLADPEFIARAGETNRVVLLLGKSYCVSCDMPVVCVGTSVGDVEVCQGAGGRLEVCRRVFCDFVGQPLMTPRPGALLGASGGGRTILLHPEPEGGSVSWNGNYCCVETLSNGLPLFNCDGTCGCGGCSTGEIKDTYEGVTLTFDVWHCGCSHGPDEPHDDDPPDDPSSGPSVSATFSHDAIIFEDEYENSPGVFVPRHSTEVEAEFYVYGGTNGGSYAFTLTDGGRLQRLGGSYVPRNGTVKAGEAFHVKVRYDAVSASGREGDIKAKVEFTEDGSRQKISKEASLTAVKVEIAPCVTREGFPCRHRMGVREEFMLNTYPDGVSRSVSCPQDFQSVENEPGKYRCPIRAASGVLGIVVSQVVFHVSLSVVEPTGILCTSGFDRCEDGSIAMELEPYITPMDVCFSNIRIMEVPTSANGPSGYFTNAVFSSVWYHTSSRGAGEWHRPRPDNFFFADTPSFAEHCPQPWFRGTIDWEIPLAWGELDASSEVDIRGRIETRYHQIFTFNAMGDLRIDKFSQWIECSADGHVSHSQGIR